METLMIIGLLLVGAFAVIGAGWFVGSIIDACSNKRRCQRIEFEKFKELYEASADKWKLDTSIVSFVKITNDLWKKDITFRFNLKDRCRYYKWKRALDKQKRNEKYSKELQEVISAINSDHASKPNKHIHDLVVNIDNRDTVKAFQEYMKKSGYTVVDKTEKEFPGSKTQEKLSEDKEK